MSFLTYIAKFSQSSYKHEKKEGVLARLFYLSPAQRMKRLNELFGDDERWGPLYEQPNQDESTQQQTPNTTANFSLTEQ